MSHEVIKPTDVSVVEISPLYDLGDFNCGDNDLNEFLKRDSFLYKKQLIAKTFVVIYKERVVGFFSVMNDALKLKQAETEGTRELKRLHEYPAIKIGRLAVDKKFQRRGVGNIILNFVIGLSRRINQVSACRFVTVDSYPNAITFYEKQGFIRNLMYEKKRDFVSMRLDIRELI